MRNLSSKKLLIRGLVTLFLTTVLVVFMPIIVTQNTWIALDVYKPNEIGDTIGGILGPCVGLIAAALTFLAFWAQYDANIEQRNQFQQSLSNERSASLLEKERIEIEQAIQNKEFIERQKQFELSQQQQQQQIILQDKRSRVNLFETRFYAMLAIHRDNSTEIEVNKLKGRKVFLHMLDELKLIYDIFKYINDNHQNFEVNRVEDENLYNIAYLSFFFGIGVKSTPLVKDLVGEGSFVLFVEKAHNFILAQIDDNKEASEIVFKLGEAKHTWYRVYSLGTGHLRRLSHYVRHLFQIVKFVDDTPDELIDQQTKYNYISNLRAQLSVHEQILLFYNAISVLGKPWIETTLQRTENYIERYCILKSMPLNAADFYKKPTDIFAESNSDGKPMFEWVEIRNRMKIIN